MLSSASLNLCISFSLSPFALWPQRPNYRRVLTFQEARRQNHLITSAFQTVWERGEKESKSQNSSMAVIVAQWFEFPVWIISPEPLRQGQLKGTRLQTPFIHEGLGHSVSRRVALLDLRGKHMSYWGIRYPIMGQAIPYRPPVVMGKWPWRFMDIIQQSLIINKKVNLNE